MISRALSLIYVILGVIVANSHGYLAITTLGSAISAILAILLWPLVLLGVDLRLGLG
jgi:hypothetical protein